MLMEQNQACLVLVDVQEKLTPLVLDSKTLIARCAWMLRLAKKLNVPVIVTEQYPKGLGQTITELQTEVEVVACSKTSFSCLSEPSFKEKLQAIHRKQVILIGIETHVCILQTALSLKKQGYEVFVVVDAVSARKKIDHKTALKRMQQAGCLLVTTEMVLFEWLLDAKIDGFKTISQAFLQGA